MKLFTIIAIVLGMNTSVMAQSEVSNIAPEELFYAAESCDMDTLRKGILEQGISPNVSDYERRNITPLMVTVRSDCHEGTRFLLEQGADINQANNIGYTPLMGAAIGANVDSVRLLLSYPHIQVNAVFVEGGITVLQMVKAHWVAFLTRAVSDEEELNGFIERALFKKQDNHDEVVANIKDDIERARNSAEKYAEIIVLLEEAGATD
jgi:ankyrin repeat protein